ncbi:hypothetical protein [Kineococcus aurantiacus]|uniref:Uncharacterized protein n=1 Tax=Kineococcus aurantiacus TaxID=37633 RepID=A0A7Y9AT37_9ACTN|nr:hypothetical protein [Kineococcus aurantiacus]NYD21572.1 hypothetical protein [Kineococcus aurantiacus]
MSVTTTRTAGSTRVPAQRRAPRQQAAVAALDAALQESGCILVSTSVVETGCTIAFYDARSLGRAVDVLADAATRAGDDQLAARARQRGSAAWKVTARPQTWAGAAGDPDACDNRSATTWHLDIPAADIVPSAAALLA